MKYISKLLLLVASLLYFQVALGDNLRLSVNDSETRKLYETSEKFLTGLGFKNYSTMATKTLQNPNGIHPVSLLALQDNARFYKSLEEMKSLANLSYAFLAKNQKLSSAAQEHNLQILLNIAVQQTMPFPLVALEPVLDPQYKTARGRKAMDIREDYLYARAQERFQIEKSHLLKAYTYLYKQFESSSASELKEFQQRLDHSLDSILKETYTNSEAQQNRHLGRALLAVIVKFARDNKLSSLEDRLRQQLASVNVHMDDILTAKYRPLTLDKNQSAIQLKNGDLAFEFSNGQDAYFTAMGVMPGTPENNALAKKYDLMNTYSNIPLFISQKFYNDALERQRSNLVLSNEQTRVLNDFWDPYISKGYSHVAMVKVLRDSQSGISLAWIHDIFPNEGFGRVRVMSPEGFAFPERNIRVGFARYDAKKVLQLFKQQIKERGYLDVIFESRESSVVDGSPKINPAQRFQWHSEVQQDVVNKWMSLREDQAENWYQNQLLPRVFKMIEEAIYSKEALVFANNMMSARSTSYCSEFIKLAFLKGGNVDIAPISDQLRDLSKIAAKYYPEKVGIEENESFVSPNGLVWQSQILQSHMSFNFSRARVERQTYANDVVQFYTNYLGSDAEVKDTSLLIKPSGLSESEIFIYDDRGS